MGANDYREVDERQELQDMLEQLSPESRTFFAEATLGRDAKEFFNSDIGRYMVGCAQHEYAEASAELKNVPWYRPFKLSELQNKMWRAENFMVWLRDLIIKGTAAELALQDREVE